MPSIIERYLFRLGGNKIRIALARKWGVRIGNNCVIMTPCTFVDPYLVLIGNDVVITAGVMFITHDGAIRIFLKKAEHFNQVKTCYGPIVIRDNCFIGTRALILQNITIGPNSVVGAGSVVTKDVPPNSIYAGNPARFFCSYDEYLEKCKLKSTGDLPRGNRKALLIKKFSNILQC